jgi:hypothetical protein
MIPNAAIANQPTMYQHFKQLCLGNSDSSQSMALAFHQLEFVSSYVNFFFHIN